MSVLRHLAFILEGGTVIPAGNLVARLPWRVGGSLARLAGRLLFLAAPKARRQACENLDVIFGVGALSPEEKSRIVRNLFIHLASSALEYLKIGELTLENYHRFIHVENPEARERVRGILEEGKGMIAVTAHVGNWEFMARAAALEGFSVAAVIHRQLNPYTDRWLANIRRYRASVEAFYDDPRGLKRTIHHLKNNGLLALVADEARASNPLRIPFFGRLASVADGPAKLHLRYGSPLVFLFCPRGADGRYILSFDGPYRFESQGDRRKDRLEVMKFIFSKYEDIIRKHPDQWFCLPSPWR